MDTKARTALLHRTRPMRGPFLAGTQVYVWRKPGAIGRDRERARVGPGHVICGDNSSVWCELQGQLVKCAPEHLGYATRDELRACQEASAELAFRSKNLRTGTTRPRHLDLTDTEIPREPQAPSPEEPQGEGGSDEEPDVSTEKDEDMPLEPTAGIPESQEPRNTKTSPSPPRKQFTFTPGPPEMREYVPPSYRRREHVPRSPRGSVPPPARRERGAPQAEIPVSVKKPSSPVRNLEKELLEKDVDRASVIAQPSEGSVEADSVHGEGGEKRGREVVEGEKESPAAQKPRMFVLEHGFFGFRVDRTS